jgi:hypothetical protein
MSVFAWFKEDRVRYTGARYGIELEIEGDGLQEASLGEMSQLFRTTPDGSLRNGIELVSSPLTMEQVQQACQMYNTFCRGRRISLSPRCSTHIHVNVQDMNEEQFRSMVWLSVALEPVLLRYCSELRNHNTYTVPVYNSVNLVQFWNTLLKDIKDKRRGHVQQRLTSSVPKYCAVGAFRLFEYGTLEFRMFPGCKDGVKLLGWVQMLDSIRELAMTTTVTQLRDRKVQDGVRALLTEQLLAMRKSVSIPELCDLIEKGTQMANDITREVKTVDQLLALHQQLFPEAAPFRIIKGTFWSSLNTQYQAGTLDVFLAEVQKDQFIQAYSGRSRVVDLFTELSANTDPVTAADIVIAVKRTWGV